MSTRKTGMETHTNRGLLLAALSVMSLSFSSAAFADEENFCKKLGELQGAGALKTIDNGNERDKTAEECQASLKTREDNLVAATIQYELDPELVKTKSEKAAEQMKEIAKKAGEGTASLSAYSCATSDDSLRLCGTEWVKDIYMNAEPKPKAPCALVSAIAVNGSGDAVIAVGERGHILKASIADLDSKDAFNLDKICTVERDERETAEWREKYGPSDDKIGAKVAEMKAAAIEAETSYDPSSMKKDAEYAYYADGEVPSVWKQIVQVEGGTRVALNDVFFIKGSKIGYIVGYDGVVLKTTDDGNTWKLVYSQPPVNNDVPETNFFGVYFRNANHGWAVGSRGNIHSTRDGGATWTKATLTGDPDTDVAQYNSIEQLGDGSLFATGNDGFMLRSSDLGQTWVKHTALTMGSLISFCHDTYQFGVDKKNFTCQECKSFETRVVASGDCVRTCPTGQAKNDAGECAVMECPEGSKWSDDEQKCAFSCEAGFVFNEFDEACVEVLTCEGGQAWNTEDFECADLPECEDDTVRHPVNAFEDCVDPSEVADIVAEAKAEAEESEGSEEQKVARYIGAVFGQVPLDQTRILVHSMSGSAFVSGNLNPSAAGATNKQIITSWHRFNIPTSVSFFGGTRLRNGEVVVVGSKGTVVVSTGNASQFAAPINLEGEPELVDVIEHPTKDGLLILVGDGGPHRHQL